jgi:hypothetical protein
MQTKKSFQGTPKIYGYRPDTIIPEDGAHAEFPPEPWKERVDIEIKIGDESAPSRQDGGSSDPSGTS